MLIKIGDDYFNTLLIAAIRPVDDGDQTNIFIAGQSAIDGGFLVDVPIEDVIDVVQNARLMEIAQMMTDVDEDGPEPHPDPDDQ